MLHRYTFYKFWDAKYQDEYNWCKWLEKDLNERLYDESEEENELIEYTLNSKQIIVIPAYKKIFKN
jgi:hypothetical protein